MADTGWYARRLGGQQTLPPQNPNPNYPPTYQPTAPPPGPPPNQYQQPQPVGPGGQPLPEGQIPIMDAVQMWRGGPAHRTDPHPCPSCGGQHYYSRTQGPSRGPAPAPMCFDCGYNGMFDQGDPAIWGSAG